MDKGRPFSKDIPWTARNIASFHFIVNMMIELPNGTSNVVLPRGVRFHKCVKFANLRKVTL